MNLTSAFEIGQKVWHVHSYLRAHEVTCGVCQGAGKVKVVGVDDVVQCPRCYGKGITSTGAQVRITEVSHRSLTIGQIRIEVEGPTPGDESDRYRYRQYAVDQSNMGPRSYKRAESFMCVETGIGSGTIYRRGDLFATREEAEAAAARRTQQFVDDLVTYDTVAEEVVS